MDEYYRLDLRKLTFGERWRMNPSAAIAGLLHLPVVATTGLPLISSVKDIAIPEAAVAASSRAQLSPLMARAMRLGFNPPRFYRYETLTRDAGTLFAAFLHPSGITLRIYYTENNLTPRSRPNLSVILLNDLADGTYLVTSGRKAKLPTASGIRVNRLVGASIEKLVAAHQKALGKYASTSPAKPVESREALDALWDRYERHCREYGFQRGHYTMMKPEELAPVEQDLAVAKAMAAGSSNPENESVFLAIHQIQNQKSSWVSAIWILIISLVLFVGVGTGKYSADYLVILLFVLFIHESGHYLAMRYFHYRNVKMFFIPLFGAAVSGRHYNVAGWKKVVVSLMGPLPGIFLGIILGSAGVIFHYPLLIKIAIVLVFLNGFNLLPILPLDGGWIFHSLIFSRHYILDAAFRVIAAIGLAVLSVKMGSRYLVYVGIAMVSGLPQTIRAAQIVTRLRKTDLPPASPDGENIPTATADAIIDELRKTSTKPQSNRLLAQQTLRIFETLNARPPAWSGTLALLTLHLSCLMLAGLFAFSLLHIKRNNYRFSSTAGNSHTEPATTNQFFRSAANYSHTVDAGTIQFEDRSPQSTGYDMLTTIANFKTPDDARTVYQEIKQKLPVRATERLFGETLLVTAPVENSIAGEAWREHVYRGTTNVFLSGPDEYLAGISLIASAPDNETAREVAKEINTCYSGYHWLIPPWQKGDGRTTDVKASNQIAFRTYGELLHIVRLQMTNDESIHWQNKLLDALQVKDQAGITRANEQLTRILTNAIARSAAEFNHLGATDNVVIELYEQNWLANARHNVGLQQMYRRIGDLPETNDRVSYYDRRFAAYTLSAAAEGGHVYIWGKFYDPAIGAFALVDWLGSHDFTNIRYEFTEATTNKFFKKKPSTIR